MRLPGSRNFKDKYIPPEASAELRPLYRRLEQSRAGQNSEQQIAALRAIAEVKARYAPHFPLVAMTYSSPGRIVSRDDLERAGLVAAPEVLPPAHVPPRLGIDKWPDYDYNLRHAPRKADGSPDRSNADYFWCLTAISWGHSIEDTAARLLDVSEKARDERAHRNPGYALVTARNAARGHERNAVSGRGRA